MKNKKRLKKKRILNNITLVYFKKNKHKNL